MRRPSSRPLSRVVQPRCCTHCWRETTDAGTLSYLPGTLRRSGGGRISESRLWPVPLQNRLLERDWRALCYAEASRSFLTSAPPPPPPWP